MAETGEQLGTARINIVVNSDTMAPGLAAAKGKMAQFGQQAETEYNRATAADKRYAQSLLRQIDTMGKSRAEQIAYNAQLRIGGDLGTKLAAKALAQEAALQGVGGATKAAAHAMSEFTLNNSFARRELGRLVTDVARGNFGRFEQTSFTLANAWGLLGKLFSPAGAAIAAVTAAMGGMGIAMLKGEQETLKFNQALIGTGAASTATAGQLVDIADRIGAATGRYGGAADALTQLANTGKYSSSELESLTRTALDFATATGGKVADGIRFVDGVMGGSLNTLTKLDQQYHFLSATQLEHIRTLDDEGQSERANAIAQQAASQAVRQRANEVKESVGIMLRGWDSVKEHAAAAWAAMKDVGAAHSVSQQLKDAMAELAAAQKPQYAGAGNYIPVNDAVVATLQARVNDLRRQLVAQGFAQTAAAVDQNAETKSKAALGFLDQFKTPLEAFKDATAKAKKELDDAMLGHLTADEIARAKMHYEQALAAAQKTFDSATKQPGESGGGRGATSKLFDSDAYQQKAFDEIQKQIQAEGKLMDQRQRAVDSVKAYQNSLDDMLKTRQAQIDLQVQSVGMGQLEVQQRDALIAIDEDYDRKKADLQKRQQDSSRALSQAAYQQQLDDLKAYHDHRVEMEINGWAAERAAQENGMNGMTAAIQDFLDEQHNVAAKAQQFTTNFIDGFSDAFARFASGTESAKSAFGSFIDDLYQQALKALANKAIQEVLQLGQTGPSGLNAGYFGQYDEGAAENTASGIISALGYAKGGAFGPSGEITAFANGGVINSPHLFKFASGTGLMGEAGPEAIMPLKRLPSGKLGVEMTGGNSMSGGGNSKSYVTINKISVQPTSTRRTANQIASAIALKQRIAAARNG